MALFDVGSSCKIFGPCFLFQQFLLSDRDLTSSCLV